MLDLGCGAGHSFHRLAPRETVGVDLSADALAAQARRTLVADMRALPFADGQFESVISVHSVEHVPDPERVVAEAARVLAPDGVCVFVTPNRLTFGRPDEIIDPYHHVELDPDELRDLCRSWFDDVAVHGVFGSPRYLDLFDSERATLDRLLAADRFRLRRYVPQRARQIAYDLLLRFFRRGEDPRAEAIDEQDFELRAEGLDACLDVVAVCRAARGGSTRGGA